MNIHLIPAQKFTDRFIELIDSKFAPKSNLIYVYEAGEGFKCIESENTVFISDIDEVDLTLLESNGKFFVHGFYDRRVLRFLFRKFKKFKKNQLVLIAWGADIYNDRFLLENNYGLHLKTRIYEIIKRKIICSSNIYMTFACADAEVMNNYYGGHGKQFDCLYPSNADIDLLDSLKGKQDKKECVRILLGNSATPTNQHIEALDFLKKFSEEKLEIICPLSYGDENYGKQVIDYGKKIFGSKFTPVLNYMSPSEYSELLNSVQIAVFNHNRQQGTGNIEILAYLGKKLFLRSDTTTWRHYVERDKCCFADTTKIPEMTFNDFINFSDEQIEINENYFKKIWDIDYVKSLWDEVIGYNE